MWTDTAVVDSAPWTDRAYSPSASKAWAGPGVTRIAALSALAARDASLVANLGTGRGYSVLEVVRAFEAASGRPVPYEIVARRPGDVAACYASTDLAEKLLGWRAQYGLQRMCEDHWRWQEMNPLGFAG